jgi:hypothetical protein
VPQHIGNDGSCTGGLEYLLPLQNAPGSSCCISFLNPFLTYACHAEHFARVRPPKVLITTCYKPTKIMYTFISELLVSRGQQGCRDPVVSVLC